VASVNETKKPNSLSTPCTGPEEAARRDRAVDDSIESIVAALKRVHCATEATGGLGSDCDPPGDRGLLYDIADINARYVRQLLGVAARANDQLTSLFDHAYTSPGALKEKSIDLKLKRETTVACALFRLENATRCEVNVDFPGVIELRPDAPTTPNARVEPVFIVQVVGQGGWEKLCSATVPASGALDVIVTIPTTDVATGSWRAETIITTDANHDLGLVIELPDQ